MRGHISISGTKLSAVVKMLDFVPIVAGVASSTIVQLKPSKGNKVVMAAASSLSGKAVISVDGEIGKTYYLDRRLFFPWVLADPRGKTYKVQETDKGVTFVHGRRKFEAISFTPVIGYGNTVQGEVQVQFSDQQRKSVKVASKYAVRDPSVRQLSCVHIHNGNVYSSNELAIFCYRSKEESLADVTLPFLIADLVDSPDLKTIQVGDKGCCLHYPVGSLSLPGYAKSKEGFPIKAVRERFSEAAEYPLLFRASCKHMFEALKRFQAYVASLNKQELILRIHGFSTNDGSVISIKCDAPQGEFKETVKIQAGKKVPFNCEWLFDLLAPLLDVDSSDWLSVYGTEQSPSYLLKVGPYRLLVPRRETK